MGLNDLILMIIGIFFFFKFNLDLIFYLLERGNEGVRFIFSLFYLILFDFFFYLKDIKKKK